MKTSSIATVLGFVVFAFFSVSLKREMRGNAASSLMIQRGMTAPDFGALDLSGNRVDLYDIAHASKAVVVMFWATWCEPCRNELTNFQKMYPGKKKMGMEFLAVNLDPPEVQNFPFVKELAFPVLLDQGQTIAKQYGIRSLPSSVVVGSGATPRVLVSMEGPVAALFISRFIPRQ